MFIQNQLLVNQVDFDNAMLMEIPVSIWRGNQYFDFGGFITQHDEEAVYISGDCFVKNEFVFKVRS